MRNRIAQQDGVALITALLAVIILGGLATVFLARAVTESRASIDSQQWETTLHTGEAAADLQIAAMNADDDHVTHIGALPVEVTVAQVEDPNTWLLDLFEADPDPVLRDPAFWISDETGEAFAVRPQLASGQNTNGVPGLDGLVQGDPVPFLFALGATPSFDAPNPVIRVLRLRLQQDFYTPEFALITGGNLRLGGSSEILSPDCVGGEGCVADVQVNGIVEDTSIGSARIEGQIRIAGGGCPSGYAAPAVVGGCVPNALPQPLPDIRAASLYANRNDPLNKTPLGAPTEWFDLCPDATARKPSDVGPCLGTVVWDQAAGVTSNHRGWDFRSAQNSWRASALESGAYYVHHANVDVRGTSGDATVSIIVEGNSANPGGSGNLSIQGSPKMQAALPSVLFVADRDIRFTGGGSAGGCTPGSESFSGLIATGEQFDPGGGISIRGAIVIQDREDLSGLVTRNLSAAGGMCLGYDPDLAVNLTGIWVITHWNEL